MKKFAIHFPLESYFNNGKVNDFGKIHIQLNDYVFPDKEWTDFGQIIIYWWIDAFYKLLSKEENKVECDFMDGNYRFIVKITDSPHIWQITLIKEWADAEQIENECEIDVKQATDEILRVVTEIKDSDRTLGEEKFVKNIEDFLQKFYLARDNYLTDKILESG